LGATLEASDNGILVTDSNAQVLHTNQRFSHMWLISDKVVTGEHKFWFASATKRMTDPKAFIRGVDAMSAAPAAELFDTIAFQDGRIFERTSLPMRLHGAVVGRVWSFRDISERKRMDLLLRQERDRAQSYLDTVEATIVGMDCSGYITRINRKGCQLLGWSESELLGKSWFEYCLPQPQGLEQVYPYFLGMISGSNDFLEYHENEIITRTGEFRFIAWHNAVLRDDSGTIIGVLSAGEDIGERKLREAEIEGYQNSLELLVYVRTGELAVAKEKAEASNRAKSIFLANMSHELRTPLNAILGFARLLERKEGIDPESLLQVATINRSGQHLLTLINDVLEISRIEAGRTDIKKLAFDLPELLSDVAEMFRNRAQEKGLQFELGQSILLPQYVLGDAQHLKQVLINLLANAVKYTNIGHVGMRVSPNGGGIAFDISDTGPGISEEDQPKLFQAFYQTENGIQKGEGTGLGLAISFEFSRLMGGVLSVQSQIGHGSVFTLKLELPVADDPKPSLKVGRGQVVGLLPGIDTPRILVVDDKADNREMIQQVLAAVGFEVQTVDDGKKAVAAYVAWRPQLIWMDMRMPVMDGYDSTRQIRALPQGDKLKIVALTASAFDEDRREIFAAGCDDLVSKPVNEENLFMVMGVLLNLQYRYADAQPVTMPFVPVRLMGLPAGLIHQLKNAADALDMEVVRSTIQEISEIRPEVKNSLNTMLVEFRFDRLTVVCEEFFKEMLP
jgi:PAS domain S-box-containing protein